MNKKAGSTEQEEAVVRKALQDIMKRSDVETDAYDPPSDPEQKALYDEIFNLDAGAQAI